MLRESGVPSNHGRAWESQRFGILGHPVEPGDDACKRGASVPFPIQISNSHDFAFSRRRASWAFSFFSPF
jgi:hypothetical protein